jgi:hypothetical protein
MGIIFARKPRMATGLLAASGAVAQATELLGNWQGEVTTYGYPLYLDFLTASGASFTGTINVPCGSSTCGTPGPVDITGSLVGDALTIEVAGSTVPNGFATLSANGDSLSGYISDQSQQSKCRHRRYAGPRD